jgi:hypothetical protein
VEVWKRVKQRARRNRSEPDEEGSEMGRIGKLGLAVIWILVMGKYMVLGHVLCKFQCWASIRDVVLCTFCPLFERV